MQPKSTTQQGPVVATASTVGTDGGWRTLREPQTGLAIDLPPAWVCRTGRISSRRLLGLYMESAPRWGDASAPWNTLQVEPEPQDMALVIRLDTGRMPASLDAVLGDAWARLFRLKVLQTLPDVRVGGLTGFGVVHDLQGAGPSVALGPVRISTMTFKDPLVQTQWWLRGQGHDLHVQHVTPKDASAVRATIDRVLATLRFER